MTGAPLSPATRTRPRTLSRGAGVLRRFVVLGASWGEGEMPSARHRLLESNLRGWGVKGAAVPGRWQGVGWAWGEEEESG